MTAYRVLIVGPHPDDIEIGAAGLSFSLCRAGWDVTYLVMTDESEHQILRRQEAIAAAGIAGLSGEKVIFAGFRDGSLAATGKKLRRLRKIVTGPVPDLVVVNHRTERHTDHKATSELIENLFPDVPTLEYAVGNYIDATRFHPTVFVDLDDDAVLDVKRRAMRAHQSQVDAGRIREDVYERLWCSLAVEVGLTRAEPFEARNFDAAAYRMVSDFNASQFERLWTEKLRFDELTVLHDESRHLPYLQVLDELRHTFRQRPELPAITMTYVSGVHSREALDVGNVLLVGGADTNPLTANIHNRLPDLRFRVTYDESGSGPVNHRLHDSSLGVSRYPAGWVNRTAGVSATLEDYALLTVRRNPLSHSGVLMAVAGTTPAGTAGLLASLLRPTVELVEIVGRFEDTPNGIQAVFRLAFDRDSAVTCELVDSTLAQDLPVQA